MHFRVADVSSIYVTLSTSALLVPFHNVFIHHIKTKYKLSNRRAIGEHTSTAVNCIPPAEVALHLAFGDFERNGDIYGHWGRDEGVE